MSQIKLPILLVMINLWSQIRATKYCSYELNGDPKYFVCARNEYCCNLGCCVHLAFQFYQLWYYWLLLIFMFMICSGGSWWYKFCRQNDTLHYPSMPPLTMERSAAGTGRHNNFPEISSSHTRRYATAAHVSATTNRAFDPHHHHRTVVNPISDHHQSTYHFHRIWKGNNTTPTPSYYTAVRFHNSDLDPRRRPFECPYYQLYGPPPSYESVVQLMEGNSPTCVLLPPTTTTATATTVASGAQSLSMSLTSAEVPVSMTPKKTIVEHTVSSSSPSLESSGSSSPAISPVLPVSPSVDAPSAVIVSLPSTSDPVDSKTNTNTYSHQSHHYRHLIHHSTIHNSNSSTVIDSCNVTSTSSSATSSASAIACSAAAPSLALIDRIYPRVTSSRTSSSAITSPINENGTQV